MQHNYIILGVTSYAIARVNSIDTAFQQCFTSVMENKIIEYTNMQGTIVYGRYWIKYLLGHTLDYYF